MARKTTAAERRAATMRGNHTEEPHRRHAAPTQHAAMTGTAAAEPRDEATEATA
jgi:hypothetical protein